MILADAGLAAIGFLSAGVMLVGYAIVWDHRHVDVDAARRRGGGERELVVDTVEHPTMSFDEALEHLYDEHFDVWSGLEPGVTIETLNSKHLSEHLRLARTAE